MSDLIQCPKCGLRQSLRHSYCARCEYQFTGSAEEAVYDDRVTGTATATPTASPTTSPRTPSAPSAGLDVFAGLADASFDAVASSPPGDSGSFRPLDRGDAASLRRDDLPPRSDSIRASTTSEHLVADRGSLGRRLSQPAGRVTERPPPPEEDELPAAPSWSMPNRTTVRKPIPLEGDTDEAPYPPPGADVTTSGSIPDFLVRGRPQDELYASEHSIPPEDALLADLVSGRVLGGQGESSGDWDQPPIHPTFSDVAAPTEPYGPGGPRVVPPSLGSRRGSTASRRVDPRGRSVASAPEARELDPDSAYVTPPAPEPDLDDAADFDLGLGAASVRLSGGPSIPPSLGRRPVTTAGSRAPVRSQAPGPEARPATSHMTVAQIVLRLGLVLAAGVLLLAVVDGLKIARARAALVQSVDHGIGPNGPTPDLPVVLRERVAELGVEGAVEHFATQLEGSTDTYRIGLQMRSSVAAFPFRWQVVREGSFKIDRRIKTLQVFVAAGWELDESALNQLVAYNEGRRQFRETEARDAQTRGLADDDDSAGNPEQ